MNHPLIIFAITLLTGSAALAQSSSPTISTVTIEQAQQAMQVLDNKIADTLAAGPPLAPKDMFESTAAFNKRKQQWSDQQEQRAKDLRRELEQLKQAFYVDSTAKPLFVSYDADSETLVAQLTEDFRFSFNISTAKAKEMFNSWAQVAFAYRFGAAVLDQDKLDNLSPGLVWQKQVYAGNRVGGVYKIGGGVSAPQATYKPEPEYSEEARKAKYQGEVWLSVIVDEKGVPQDIKVTRKLGLGLDEKAVEAASKWRFKPGTKNGMPVAVQAILAISFHLL